jgi:FkbM family methyltransferase
MILLQNHQQQLNGNKILMFFLKKIKSIKIKFNYTCDLIWVLCNVRIKDILKIILNIRSLPEIIISHNSHGIFCNLKNDVSNQHLFSSGITEKHFIEIVNILISEEANVLDIGANIGTHSMLISKRNKNNRIFSFEPQSLIFSILQNNIILNNCCNVFPFKFAISDIDNKVVSMEPFLHLKEKTNNGFLSLSNNPVTIGDLSITKKIDSLKLPPISFIKIDVQGSELKVLNGAINVISSDRPIIFIEIEELHLKKQDCSSEILINKILSYNYAIYRIETPYPCDHLCIPFEKIELFENNLIKKFTYKFSKIYGKKIQLFFLSNKDQFYRTFNVIN